MASERQRTPGLVSVLVPSYNHADFVLVTLESLANGIDQAVELLVADDCSADGTYELTCNWVEANQSRFSRVSVTRNATNRGVAQTLNDLVAASSGEFVAMVASDDVLVPGGLTKRRKFLEAHDEYAAVIGGCRVMNERGHVVHRSAYEHLFGADLRALSDPDLITRELLLRWSVPGPVLMLRGSWADQQAHGEVFDPTMRAEDRDLYLRLLAHERLGFVGEEVAGYRLHDTNVSRDENRSDEILEDLMVAERKHARHFAGVDRLTLEVGWRAKRSRLAIRRGRRIAFVPLTVAYACHKLILLVHILQSRLHRRGRNSPALPHSSRQLFSRGGPDNEPR